MTGITFPKVPTWQGKSAGPLIGRRHVHFPFSRSIPEVTNAPGEGWDPTRGYDDGMGSGGYTDMNTQNDYWEWNLGALMAGTWTISLFGVKDDNRGIATFSINGVAVATIDTYAAANDYPGSYSSTTFVLATTQDVIFRISNPTKRAAAIGYQISIRQLALDRTGA